MHILEKKQQRTKKACLTEHSAGTTSPCPTAHNVPKVSDRQVWANSAGPDQTAAREAVWSGSALFAFRPFYLLNQLPNNTYPNLW